MSREELDPASNAEEAVSDVRTKCKSSAHNSALWAKVVLENGKFYSTCLKYWYLDLVLYFSLLELKKKESTYLEKFWKNWFCSFLKKMV